MLGKTNINKTETLMNELNNRTVQLERELMNCESKRSTEIGKCKKHCAHSPGDVSLQRAGKASLGPAEDVTLQIPHLGFQVCSPGDCEGSEATPYCTVLVDTCC